MNHENPPPYTAEPPAPGFSIPPPGGHQPPLQPMKPPYSTYEEQPQLQPQMTHVIVTSGPTITVFGPNPKTVICPSCHAEIVTAVKTEPNTKTHLFALILCLFQCYLCCCIPYCVDSCQSQNHYCPNCQAFLGSYQN